MTKYNVTSGFLGAGKTTSMIALAKSINSRGLGSAAVLIDDLGAKNIVDADYTSACGVPSLSISGDCICYQHENLIDRLHQLEKAGADVIFSDIPGLGIGALDNVYLQMKEREPGEFDLMPFTCIVDPERIRMIMPEAADINLPKELSFLLDAQMKEADLIILNKTDTVSEARKEEILRFIETNYPQAQVMAFCALSGEGVDEAADYLLSSHAPAEHRDIGYGSEAFMLAESKLCWYNRRVFLEQKENRNLDFNQVFSDIFEGIRKGMKEKGGNVPHLKMFASDSETAPTDVFKASLIGIDYDTDFTRKLKYDYSAISLNINARAAAGAQDMSDIVEDAIEKAADKYQLRARTYFLESFGMMDEGRGNTGRASKY